MLAAHRLPRIPGARGASPPPAQGITAGNGVVAGSVGPGLARRAVFFRNNDPCVRVLSNGVLVTYPYFF